MEKPITRKGVCLISVFSFFYVSLQLISSSNVVRDVQYLANISLNRTQGENTRRDQRICIIAGPHKTGTSSIQTNLWWWSRPTFEFSSSSYPPLKKHVIEWIWPVPREIATLEMKDTTAWDWTPSKVFYPMMEALRYKERKKQSRSIFFRYTASEIVSMYHDRIQTYWSMGHNIVFGTEAMDVIVKIPAEEGAELIRNFAARILPANVDGSQVTVIVAYRTPKIKHLVSVWHQNCVKKSDPEFYEWITTTKNNLGTLDGLGMVELFLENTDWNIALVDLEGLSEEGWDPSNFVACELLGEQCENMTPVGLQKSDIKPVVTNVRSDNRPPNVSENALDEMDKILLGYDCNYMMKLEEWIDETVPSRVTLYHPEGIKRTITQCQMLKNTKEYPLSRQEMKERIVNTTLRYGAIELE